MKYKHLNYILTYIFLLFSFELGAKEAVNTNNTHDWTTKLRFSDQRLKENIEPLKYNPNLIHIIQPYALQDVSGNSQSLEFSIENLETVDTRLLADEMETSVTPGIDLAGIAAILISEVKALRIEVDTLKDDQRVGY